MQEDEKVPTVEETIETDPSPVEPKTANDVPQEPADAIIEPEEKEVSKSVPYERFKEINDKYKTLEDQVTQILAQQTPQQQAPELDPDSTVAVKNLIAQEVVNQKVFEFKARHDAELKANEMLSIAFEREMRKQSAAGQIIDPESALSNARTFLDASVKPATEQAKQEGLKEGQDIAKTKQQLGAVGETGKQPEVDPDDLPADEFAKYHGLK